MQINSVMNSLAGSSTLSTLPGERLRESTRYRISRDRCAGIRDRLSKLPGRTRSAALTGRCIHLDDPDVFGLEAFGAFNDVELYRLAFLKRTESLTLDR